MLLKTRLEKGEEKKFAVAFRIFSLHSTSALCGLLFNMSTTSHNFVFSSIRDDAPIAGEASCAQSAAVASDATQTSENTEAALAEPP